VPYKFAASGQWVDEKVKFAPDGTSEGAFHLGDIGRLLGSAIGEIEEGLQSLVKEKYLDLWGSKRFEAAPWFSLVGFVASEHGKNDRLLPTGETFLIGSGLKFTPRQSGYLYCYANDAWQTYDNNRGSVVLTVGR